MRSHPRERQEVSECRRSSCNEKGIARLTPGLASPPMVKVLVRNSTWHATRVKALRARLWCLRRDAATAGAPGDDQPDGGTD